MGTVRVGWIGCGRMGTAMAKRLISSDNDVVVTNRTRAKAEVLGELGATVVDAPRDLGDCDIVFVMVSADAQLMDVVSGPNGVLANESTPSVIVDCSTVSMETSANVRVACELRGVDFLAAPVSGNPKVVASGKLTLAVSGPKDAFDRVRPLFELLGHGVSYVGDGEGSRLVKICHNVFLGIVTQSLAEITVLAERGGIPRSAFLEFINSSVMGSTFTKYKTPAFVNLDFTPTFTPVLLRKDFELGLAEAKKMDVPMPLAALCTQIVISAIGAGYVNDDFAVLLLEEARSAGLVLESENLAIDDGLGAKS
jgi:3-hydroxyisobutyrate dehydrogenase-like beta-hydroxyacid dehydrogenase